MSKIAPDGGRAVKKRWIALAGAAGVACAVLIGTRAWTASPVVNSTVAIVDPYAPAKQVTVTAGGALMVDGSTAGGGTVNIAPSSAAGVAITPTVSAAAESNHVICSAACNLWSAYVTTGATGGYFMSFNATSLPGNGAVTPIECVQAPANTTQSLTMAGGPPDRYSTGVTLGFSTTGCFSLTASATAFFKARASQ